MRLIRIVFHGFYGIYGRIEMIKFIRIKTGTLKKSCVEQKLKVFFGRKHNYYCRITRGNFRQRLVGSQWKILECALSMGLGSDTILSPVRDGIVGKRIQRML